MSNLPLERGINVDVRFPFFWFFVFPTVRSWEKAQAFLFLIVFPHFHLPCRVPRGPRRPGRRQDRAIRPRSRCGLSLRGGQAPCLRSRFSPPGAVNCPSSPARRVMPAACPCLKAFTTFPY